MNHRGTSLLELLVAVTLTALLAIMAAAIQARAAAVLRDRSERMALEQALRAVSGVLRQTGEALGRDPAAGPDMATAAPTAFVARVTRASGVLCGAGPAGVMVRAGSGWWSSLRTPVPGRDSLLVLGINSGSGWHRVALLDTPTPDRCPDGSAGLLLAAGLSPAVEADLGPGAPLRVFEPVEFRAYSSSSGLWLGLRALATGEAVQPLAGPFGPSGALFDYLRPDGAPASGTTEVASLRFKLLALTEHAGGIGLARMAGSRSDSVSILVTTRNWP